MISLKDEGKGDKQWIKIQNKEKGYGTLHVWEVTHLVVYTLDHKSEYLSSSANSAIDCVIPSI